MLVINLWKSIMVDAMAGIECSFQGGVLGDIAELGWGRIHR